MIDVLRAFSTAVVAFQNGVEKIIMVEEVEQALAIQKNGFADTAKKFSISSTAVNGGSLGGWISSSSLSGLYLNELNKIQKKQATRPIKIPDSDSVIILFIDDLKVNKTEIKDAAKIKEELIKRKKDSKLNLLSRSHLSRIENQTLVDFK